MLIYYELKDNDVTEYYWYKIDRDRYNLDDTYVGPKFISYASTRIWEYNPSTDEVKYRKNRITIDIPVDRREFLIVQLAAQQYKSPL
jgi:hypothetical protein